MDLHISPRFSVGARYYQLSNELTPEGSKRFNQTKEEEAINGFATGELFAFPEQSYMLTFAYYPIYGKLNLFNLTVSQFDVYTILGLE